MAHPFAHLATSPLAGNPFPVPKMQCPPARLQILVIVYQMGSTSFFTVLVLRTVDCQVKFFQLPPNNFVFLSGSSARVSWSSTKLNLRPFCTPLALPKNSLLRQLQNLLDLPHSTLGSSFWACNLQSLLRLSHSSKSSSSSTTRILVFLASVSVLLEYLPTACSETSCEGRRLIQM